MCVPFLSLQCKAVAFGGVSREEGSSDSSSLIEALQNEHCGKLRGLCVCVCVRACVCACVCACVHVWLHVLPLDEVYDWGVLMNCFNTSIHCILHSHPPLPSTQSPLYYGMVHMTSLQLVGQRSP